MPENARIVPGWLVKAITTHLITVTLGAGYWAYDVSMCLSTIMLKQQQSQEERVNLKVELVRLQERFNAHVAEPGIHASGASVLREKIDAISNRVSRLETK